jgi:anti-sigma factor RsiW
VKCGEVATLLHAYVDGELDLVRGLEVEGHLRECAACAEAAGRLQTLRVAIADAGLYRPAPLGLRERVRATVRKREPRRRRVAAPGWRGLAIAASVALVALVGWDVYRALGPGGGEQGRTDPVALGEEERADEVVAGHVRSLMAAAGPVDEPSTNQHQVKPWFNGKVPFAPTVKNLDKERFKLVGGRLDYVAGQKVAAVVYRYRRHVINLFMWPAGGKKDRPPEVLTRRNFHLVHWVKGDLTYWVVSDLNEEELGRFVGLVRG